MNKLFRIFLFSATVIMLSCDDNRSEQPVCDVRATVLDLRGLDGCGFVFELEDGTRLEPMRIGFCGTPPIATELTADPLLNFEFVDGKKVKISYTVMTAMSTACMAGQPVKITCLTEERMLFDQ